MTDSPGPFARKDVRQVLERFGIAQARRAVGTDASEEVILLASEDYRRVDASILALAVMGVLPHTKVWVVQEDPAWASEPL